MVRIKATIPLTELSSHMADQDPFDRDLIYFMRRGGMTGAAIARALGVPYSRVRRILNPPSSVQQGAQDSQSSSLTSSAA